MRLGIIFGIIAALSGCQPRTVYVDRPREVNVYVPQTVQVPPGLTVPCPSPPEDPNVGQVLDWLQLCVALLDHQRRLVSDLK